MENYWGDWRMGLLESKIGPWRKFKVENYLTLRNYLKAKICVPNKGQADYNCKANSLGYKKETYY